MKGLITKIKNPHRKNVVLLYQKCLEENIEIIKEDWQPLTDAKRKYIEQSKKSVYYAPYVLGYSEHPTPDEKDKLEKLIISDKNKIAKDIKDAQKEQEDIIKAEEKMSVKTAIKKPTPKKTAVKTAVKKPTPKKPVVKPTLKKPVVKPTPKKTAIKKPTPKKPPIKKKSVKKS